MKNTCFVFSILFLGFLQSIQSQSLDFNLIYDADECKYHARAIVGGQDFNGATLNTNGIGFTVVFPASVGISSIATEISEPPSSSYGDNSPALSPDETLAYHKFFSNSGALSQAYSVGDTILLFKFKHPGDPCTEIPYIFDNTQSGPTGSNPNPNGATFENAFQYLGNANGYNANIETGQPGPTPPDVAPDFSCSNDVITLNANPGTDPACLYEGITYSWTKPDGTAVSGDPATVNVDDTQTAYDANSGTYTLTATGGNGCKIEKEIEITPDICLALPVELTSFDVEKSDETSFVSWSTATEVNNDYFNIERSKDGVHFETIGTVQGNGTTADRKTYSFEDENPMGGVNYYRLKQVDYDGAYEYSDIKNVRFDSRMSTNVTMGLYPNPANDYVSIELDGIQLDSKTMVRVFDKIGKLVLVQDVDASNQLNISELADGMYMIQAVNNDSVIATKKLVKTSSF